MLPYGPLKHVNFENTVPSKDFYSVEEPVNWQKCRETFFDKFTIDTKGFFFSHESHPDNIYRFILKTEEVLKVSGVQIPSFTSMSLTNRDYAIWVEPTHFWKNCEFRRSLFTILLRCGSNFTGTYEDALLTNTYIKNTYPAVKRFLFGYTEYSNTGNELECAFRKAEGHRTGWVNNFSNKTKDEVKLFLRKPVAEDKNFYGVGSIWG